METINIFNTILNSFKINAQCVDYKKTDNYFHYDLKLNSNVKIKDIQKISDEISLALRAPGKPNIKVLHQEGIVRLEFAEVRKSPLNLFDLFKKFKPQNSTTCLLGRQSNGSELHMDLSQNPHMIVAGTTGSGKSTLLHNIIANLLYSNKSEIHLIDPKGIEFSPYDLKFNNVNVYYDYKLANMLLAQLVDLMEFRYTLIRNGYNSSNIDPCVVIIDEFADLIMQDTNNKFYNNLCRLAQKSRAAKIHLILATQRPSVNVINGTIKANFPARISCKVSSHIDSKVVLDSVGAETLLGKGDALVKDNFRFLERFQVAYTTPEQNITYFKNNGTK